MNFCGILANLNIALDKVYTDQYLREYHGGKERVYGMKECVFRLKHNSLLATVNKQGTMVHNLVPFQF
jgi:hypothetical protein